MSIDPRTALSALTTALEEHLVAASARRGEEDPIVEATFLGIIDAFEDDDDDDFDGDGTSDNSDNGSESAQNGPSSD